MEHGSQMTKLQVRAQTCGEINCEGCHAALFPSIWAGWIAADVMFNVECGWCTPSDSLLYLIRDCASPKVHVIVGLLIAMLFAGQHTTTIARL